MNGPCPAPRALLVDFYGTLVHAPAFSVRSGIDVMAGSLRAEGMRLDTDAFEASYRAAVKPYLELMRKGTETHNTSWVADALRALGIAAGPSDPPVVRAVRAYFEAYAESIVPLPRASEALEALSARYPVALVSNFTDALPVRTVIARQGWVALFRSVFISAELGIRKPHPDIFLRAAASIPCAPHEAIHIGDDLEEDVAGARAAGIPTVFISKSMPSTLRTLSPPAWDSPPRPDWTVDAFHETVGLLLSPQ